MEQAAIWWWIQHQQKKRSYIFRPSHLEEARQGLSSKVLWRYYNSSEVKDLKRFLRVTKTEFEHLYSILECQLGLHSPTHLRPIAGRERLAVFLRFLSFGPNYAAVATLFAIGDSTVQEICREVSAVIIRTMQAEFLPFPTRATWLSNAERFLERRQFPKTLGAIDGKHIALVQPDHAGALFYKYKKFNSIVLLAIADSDSRFIAVDIGAPGRNSDASLWLTSPIREFLESPAANLPPDLSGSLPYVFLGVGGFGCTDLVRYFSIKPSSIICSVEHAFGIWATRWRLFLGTVKTGPDTARQYAMAAVLLHNFLLANDHEEEDVFPFPAERRLLVDRAGTIALEISALLDEVGKQGGPHALLVCITLHHGRMRGLGDFRDVINSCEECLANEIYINDTQVADPEKSIQENTFG